MAQSMRAFWDHDKKQTLYGDYEPSAIMKAMHQFPEMVKMYLSTIDIHITDVRMRQETGFMHSSRGMIFGFTCRAEDKDAKYLDFATEHGRDHFPKVNPEVVAGPIDNVSFSDFTCFTKETIVTLMFEVPIDNLEDIDRFMFMLKEKTQPIQYRKFSEDMDEQIEDVLGE